MVTFEIETYQASYFVDISEVLPEYLEVLKTQAPDRYGWVICNEGKDNWFRIREVILPKCKRCDYTLTAEEYNISSTCANCL